MLADPPDAVQHDLRVNGVRIHAVEVGTGPLVIFLHGFPDFWLGWQRQLPAVAEAGFRAVASDMRGYGRSTPLSGIESYRIGALVEDVVALVEALGEREVMLVGHDWGGIVAWYAAMHHPEVVRKLAILNAPHPAAYRRELLRPSSGQALRSWYAAFFQLLWLPEAALRAGGYGALRRVWQEGPARDEQDLAAYVEAFEDPAALTAAINYYRASLRYPAPEVRRITCPTLVIWGEQDRYLVPELAGGLEAWVERAQVERLPHAGHWLHHEESDAVNRLLLTFLRDV